MYRGFNLKLNWSDHNYFQKGSNLFDSYKWDVHKQLREFVGPDGSLQGSQIQSNWFPNVKSHIFLSHSHQDEELAITLAGWLHDNFGLVSFIDSCVWGYSNDLLRLIDDRYCLNPSGETYSYEKRNFSTSHVHMMLNTALMTKMDDSECVIFINSPNSISTSRVISQTESPWIYSELSMTQVLRKKTPQRRILREKRYFSKGEVVNESLKIKYDVNLNHLNSIDADSLNNWIEEVTTKDPEKALDAFYRQNPIKDMQLIGG